MKKIMCCFISIFAFLLFVSVKVDALDYQGALGYETSINSTKFYFYIQDENIEYIDLYIDDVLVSDDSNTSNVEHMIKDDSGIYYADIADDRVSGGIKGKEYYYNICYKDLTCKTSIDPFATTINVDGNKNVILDASAYSVEGWEYLSSAQNDNPIIYSIDANKFVEGIEGPFVLPEGDTRVIDTVFEKLIGKTKYMDRDIGYNYILNSGINYLEVGYLYDSNNYFFPNHEYGSKQDNISLIAEMKEFIKEYKGNGINIVLRTDFVKLNENLRATLSTLSSNYVNEEKINLDNEMMQKYIIDVYKLWMNEYKIDSFYIEDADLYPDEYLTRLITELKSVNKDVFVYTNTSNGSEYYTSDTLQNTLFGSLTNNIKEGILNDVYSSEDMKKLLDAVFSGYYTNLKDYSNGMKIINNLGSNKDLDIYSKLVLISGLGTKESVILEKVKLALYTSYASLGIPRIVAGNEFLNTTTIPTSQISTLDENSMVCNNNKSICYAKGEEKHLNWDYLVKHGSILNVLALFRNSYTKYYPSETSLESATKVSYDENLMSQGIIKLDFDYNPSNHGEVDNSTIVINYSGKDVSIAAIENRNKDSFYSLLMVGKAELTDDSTNLAGYTFLTYSNLRQSKLPNWAYILIALALFGIIIGLRALFIHLLKVKRGINYTEYSKSQRKGKKEKKEKIKEPSVFETYLSADPVLKNIKDKNKENKKSESIEKKVETKDNNEIKEQIEESKEKEDKK